MKKIVTFFKEFADQVTFRMKNDGKAPETIIEEFLNDAKKELEVRMANPHNLKAWDVNGLTVYATKKAADRKAKPILESIALAK